MKKTRKEGDPLRVGISTACLYPMESMKALDLLLSYGYRHFEFFINSFSEMQQPFLSEFKRRLDFSGATVQSVHPFTCPMEPQLFFGDYPKRYADGIAFYQRYFEAAATLGAKIFVLHGQSRGRNGKFSLTDEEYCRRFHGLSQAGKAFGITVCQENVNNHRSGYLPFVRAMQEYLGSEANFVFDIKQCLLCNENPLEMLMAMGENLRHVHISDSDAHSFCLLPNRGTCDFLKIRDALQTIQYTGSLIVEVYSSSFREAQELQKPRIFMENLFENRQMQQ